ncbi:unnamed protein product, partial [Rhizoctonia solani]
GLSADVDAGGISGDSDDDIHSAEIGDDEGSSYDMDGASDADSESSDAEPPIYLSSPAAYDYASDSDGDADVGPSAFDNLYSISPGSSQESLFNLPALSLDLGSSNSTPQDPVAPEESPDVQGNNHEIAGSATPLQPQPHPEASSDVPPPPTHEPEPPKVLPDALRAFREWVLSHSSTGDLTVDAANSFLKTLDFCLEKDLLRCGTETNPEHRLPLTLETLQRHAKVQADLVDIFAVCPDFSCQTLRRLASMSPDRPYVCKKCGKAITRRKITRRRARKPLDHHVPILQYTYCPIVEQLKEILSRPGIWKAIDEHRKHLKREGMGPDTLEDIQHGEIWLNLKKDGELFFGDTDNIGFILMCDWFQPNSRQGAPSYSTGVISLCIANLPPHLRARPENKIVVGVIPGPHEPNVDTINNFLEPMVQELLSLWDKGVAIDDPDNGIPRDICAALVACACDSPAARKLGGFPGTGGTYPCTACWCSHKELHIFDQKFPKRTRREHKRAAKAYSKLPNKAQRQKFLTMKFEDSKPGGYRPSILLNLPYWNPEKMVIIDPMHCLFLGLVDWQFHTVWVEMKHLRPEKELAELQKMVQSTLRPRHCGRPPNGLGTSSAGSLTADPLRSLITIDLPLVIPILWDNVDIRSIDQRAHEEWARRKQIQEKKQAEARKGDKITRAATKARHMKESNNTPTPQIPRKRPRKSKDIEVATISDAGDFSDAEVLANATRIQEDDANERGFLSWRLEDDEGVLLLASAMKLLGSRTVTKGGIEKGQDFLIKYLEKCTKLRGASRIHPNHHMSTHIAKQLLRYGPMHQIWTYSGERLNYTLKNTNNNRHGGGEREKTFAISFHRRRASITRLTNIAVDSNDPLTEWASYMLTLGHSDQRGTVASETSESLDINENVNLHKRRPRKVMRLKPHHFDALADTLGLKHPELSFRRSVREHGSDPVLSSEVRPMREIILNGRVFSMASLCDSIVKAQTFESGRTVERVGEIIDIWEHTSLYHSGASGEERLTQTHKFALVRWYKASPIFLPRPVHLWFEEFPHLDIEIHEPEEYLDQEAVIPINNIICHCARMNATIGKDPVWLTIGLERE